MSEFFLTIVNMSISASWIVLAVLLLRLLLKKAPKWITVLLWGIVAVRLVCPFTIESVMSLIPSAETISPEIMIDATPEINSGIPILNNTINPVIGESFAPDPTTSANPLQILIPFLAIVWLVGIAGMLLYTAISYFKVKRKIGTAVLLRDNIFQSENVVSPFVLGIIKPKIYLPFNMNEQDMSHVIAHEQAHIRRKDHWWKPFGFLLLALYWFNPFMWIGYALLCRDIELACDEKVIKELNPEQKADYSQALLTCSVNRRVIAACPLAFGEVGVKNRVKSVLNYKKPAFWIVVTAIVASVVVAVCFLTNPKTKTWQSDNYTIMCNVISAECDNVVYEYMYGTLNVDYPYICVNWTNNTNDTLCFGDEFIIYKNGKELKPKDEIGFDAILHVVKPGKSKSENYVLSSYDLEKGATYRLEKSFYLESTPEQKYTAFISFSVDTRFSFIGKQYAGEKIVYENGSFSSIIYTNDNIPQFKISEHLEFLYKTEEVLNYEWKKIDGIQKIKLEKSNFDDLFTSEIWHDGITAKTIRKNNLNAFSSFDLNGTMYYLLEQKNGDIYIAQSNGNTSDFRWLFKMKEISKTSSAELENNNASANLSQLKEKYPQFFNVSTDGGLTVYIWQMSANNYSCYLANTSMEAISDNSFAYDVGASIAEIRAILTTYDIDQKDIVLYPVNNPLSSYYYEIDDDYRARVKEMFWATVPYADSSQYNPIIDTANFDIDGDGKEEQCALSAGPTSGLFTFIFSVSENGNLEYFNIFNSPYTELKFEKNAEGRMLLVGKSGEKTCYMGMDISDGNIVLSSDEQEVSYWGEQGLNSPYAPKAASDLNNAIAKVLNEKYQSEKPDGLIHIENYYLLAHQTASGTPLKGNTGHMKIANVYLLVYHMKYSVNGGQLEEHEGDFVPTAITFSIDENGKYTLKEYWTPQSGSNYKKDVRNKFPSEAADNALNTEKYAEALVKDSWRLANEAINKTSSVMIDDSTAIHYPANIGLYDVTPEDEVQTKYDNGEFVIRKRHYQAIDKTWVCEGYTYKYRLEITGRMNNANKKTTFIVLSNTKDITFEQTWKASGLSSLSTDYFKPEDAVIVGSS